MQKKFIVWLIFLILFASCTLLTVAANPTPAPLAPPTYNYTESNGCPSCHFSRGAGGDHMMEAVGVSIDSANTAFTLSGGGWRASRHAQSNHGSTQNTFCAKCHSPIQATPQATFNNGFLENTALIADGKMEGVTCAGCHPPHGVSPRLGIYHFGQDKTKVASYTIIQEDQQDLLCLNCHVNRHNETNAAFKRMYDAGVQCTDCHMARYGKIVGSEVNKRFHDFKVAQNLPYSCGVDGSAEGFVCHEGFSTEATLAFLPFLKEQHSDWWPLKPGTGKRAGATATRTLETPADYMNLWKEIQNQTSRVQVEQKRVDRTQNAQ
jgi:cytochrome c554/c'-like protein